MPGSAVRGSGVAMGVPSKAGGLVVATGVVISALSLMPARASLSLLYSLVYVARKTIRPFSRLRVILVPYTARTI